MTNMQTHIPAPAVARFPGVYVGRRRTHDNYVMGPRWYRAPTYDAAGNSMGVPLNGRFRTHDGRTVDSTGAFLVGELERLDMTLHNPLVAVTWGRDIDLRDDVTIADEASSFTLSTYGSPGSLGTGSGIGTGKAWIGKTTDQIAGIGVDIAKIPHPLRPWGLEVAFTILELESAAKLGRPIDAQKYAGLQLKHQMDIDEQVYIGDTVTGDTGLVNNALVTAVSNVPAGVSGSTSWTLKTPDEILADVNNALTTTWANSGYAVIPERCLLPPAQFGYISTAKVSLAGNVSILKYIQENNLLTTSGRGKLDIFPCKWLVGAGAGGTLGTVGTSDRMMVYTKEKDRVRYPMTLLQRTPLQYDSIYHKTTYFCRLGVVEYVYPETCSYWDAI
jgi:hypothetical protein